MASRQNIAERVPVAREAEEYGTEPRIYNKRIISTQSNRDIRPLKIDERRDPGRVWQPEEIRHLRTRSLLGFVQNAMADVVVPLRVFMGISLILFVVAAVVSSSPHVAGEIEVPSYVIRPELSEWEATLLGAWQHWDGLWYLKIATQGYDYWDYSIAFFPLYPLVVRVFGTLFGIDMLSAGVGASAIFYLMALVYLYKLARIEIGEEAARRSTIYLAVFPTSFFFLAVYTESLFLALSLATFFYARRGNWAIAGILGLLASLTRSTGLLLLLPLLIEYVQQHGFRLNEIRADVLNLLLIPMGTGLYAAYNLIAFGNALAFVEAQVHWQRSFTLPWQTLATAWDYAVNEANIPLVTEPDGSLIYQTLYISNLISGHALNLAFFAIGLVLTIAAFKKLRPAYALYAFLVLIVPVFNPSETMPLLSMPRFVVVLFPLFFVLALAGKNRIAHWAISVAFAFGLLLFIVRFASWYWVG